VGLVAAASATIALIFCRFFSEKYYRYARHLLGWFLPVIAAQWAVGGRLFGEHALVLCLATFLFGTYYTAADLVAVRDGVWHFDEAQITGFKLARVLPWEEIAFFYLTSLLVFLPDLAAGGAEFSAVPSGRGAIARGGPSWSRGGDWTEECSARRGISPRCGGRGECRVRTESSRFPDRKGA
jgi:lycopene cyclase domain-containing protein